MTMALFIKITKVFSGFLKLLKIKKEGRLSIASIQTAKVMEKKDKLSPLVFNMAMNDLQDHKYTMQQLNYALDQEEQLLTIELIKSADNLIVFKEGKPTFSNGFNKFFGGIFAAIVFLLAFYCSAIAGYNIFKYILEIVFLNTYTHTLLINGLFNLVGTILMFTIFIRYGKKHDAAKELIKYSR